MTVIVDIRELFVGNIAHQTVMKFTYNHTSGICLSHEAYIYAVYSVI